jgi:hypothetical protein
MADKTDGTAANGSSSALSRFDKLKALSKSMGLSNGLQRAGANTREWLIGFLCTPCDLLWLMLCREYFLPRKSTGKV